MDISERILELRRSAGYSQEKLAELLHVSRQAVSKWEAGAALPTLDNLIELSRVFQAPLDTLTGTAQQAPAQAQTYEGRESPPEQAAPGNKPTPPDRQPRSPMPVLWGVLCIALIASLWGSIARATQLQQQISQLSARLSALEARGWTQPAQSLSAGWQAQDSLVTDYSCEVKSYDPKSRLLTLFVTATPKVYTEGMQALICAYSSDATMQALEVPAELGPGRIFTATLHVPPTDALRLSIAFERGGETHTQFLDQFSGLSSYEMKVDTVFDGRVQRTGGNVTLIGEVKTHIAAAQNYPVFGKVELRAAGVTIAEQPLPLKSIYNEEAQQGDYPGTMQEPAPYAYGDVTFYTRFEQAAPAPEGSALSLFVTVRDNFACEYTQEIALQG